MEAAGAWSCPKLQESASSSPGCGVWPQLQQQLRYSPYQDSLAPWFHQPLAPPLPSIPQASGILPLPGKSVLEFGAGCQELRPPLPPWEGQAPQPCNGTVSGTAELWQLWVKKMEDKRVRKRIILDAYCRPCKSRKGFEEQMKTVAITYKLVHQPVLDKKCKLWLALDSYLI